MTTADINPALGPRTKIERAKVHLAEFDESVNAYTGSHPYKFVKHAEPDGTSHLILASHEPIPIYWCVIIGDVVHNCRSALDSLISLCASRETNTFENFNFPIFKHKHEFEEKGLEKFRKHGCLQTIRFLKRLKPYERGHDLGNPSNTLVLLHRLSIRDKHRLIVPVGTAAGYAVVKPKPGYGEPFRLVPPDNEFLQDGEIVMTISPTDPLFAGKNFETAVTTQIRLGGIEPIPPIGASAYLHHIVEIVGRVVSIGERYLLGVPRT